MSRSDALRAAVERAPQDVVLRLLLAEALVVEDRADQALQEYLVLQRSGDLGPDDALAAGQLAVACGRADLARGLAESARQAGLVEGLAELDAGIARLLAERGLVPVLAEDVAERRRFRAPEQSRLSFGDVGGLDDVKKLLHRLIVLPLARPELYATYGRRTGGGVLLYGPPGCGKTLLARAIAGECGLPFLDVRIEDVVDPYFGVSERNLAAAFQEARDAGPCVLFVDELDALGYARHKAGADSGRRLVDVLLQELDGVASSTDGLLVLAATNAPWDVDDALLRPGRFDRRVFVPPPDEDGRRRVLDVLLADRHSTGLDAKRLARTTELLSGADLRAVVERAVDEVIDEALSTGTEPPLRQEHLERAADSVRPTTLEWLERARDHVEFANASQRWDDVADYLRRRQVRKRLRGT